MVDTAKRYTLIKGRALRVTRLDSCGNPVLGPDSVVVSKGFITVTLTANNDDGNTITATNANGDNCVNEKPRPKFQSFTVEIALCGVDPALVHLTSGQDMVFDDAGTPLATGFTIGTDIDMDEVFFALELWSVVPSSACSGSDKAYGYGLLPFVGGGTIGDITIQNDAVNFTISGAETQDDNQWGVGPFNVLKTSAGVASPLLVAVGTKKHYLLDLVNLAPPDTETAGAQALGVPATSLVAGIPGHSAPTNSYAPANLAGATGITASPTTAWTTGQYVTLRDGTKAHWTGTAWAAGAA